MPDHELRRHLAELVVEALEVGTGKQEWDVVDELFAAFGAMYADVEASVGKQLRSRTQLLREQASSRLADVAPTAVDLLNVIVRCGGRFVDMLNAVYGRLTRHVATTQGSSETFRIERRGVDEEALTISPAFLEQVRQLIETVSSVPVGLLDEAAIHDFLRCDNGQFYGVWPLGDHSNGKPFTAVVLGIPLVGAVVRQRATADAAWAEVIPVWEATHAAAERLMSTATDLIRSHMTHLDVLAHADPAVSAASAYSSTTGQPSVLAEIERFRADRILGSAVFPDMVPGVDAPGRLGLGRDLTSALVPAEDDWSASGIGELASFIAMWQREVSPRHTSRLVEERLAAGPGEIADWLTWMTTTCDAAAEWLAEDVLKVKETADTTDQIEAVTEFLNLPLWRQRDLLYEVWVLCATLDACEAAEWSVELVGLAQTRGVWTLSIGQTYEPTATLRTPSDDQTRLEVWREPVRETADGLLTPDITIATPGPYIRDLLVVEAKDRIKMTSGRSGSAPAPGPRTALGVANRYVRGLHPNATWVCNHCEFRQSVDPETNHGDAWTRIHLADRFRPGNVPAAFTRSVRAALQVPLPEEPAPTDEVEATGLVLVADMTHSMGRRLDSWLADLEASGNTAFEAYRAVLYSDHGSGEPFLVRKLGPFAGIDELVSAVRAQPRGNGGDIDEALEDAMQRCVELVADIGPQTILVLTDAPAHLESDCPYGIDFHTEVRSLLRAGCRLQIATDHLHPNEKPWSQLESLAGVSFAPLGELTAQWRP